MKKLLLAFIIAMLAIFLVACGEDDEDDEQQDETHAEETTDTDDVTETVVEEDGTIIMPQMGLGGASRAEIIANMPNITPAGQIALGTSVHPTANIMHGWDNNATNAQVRRVVGGYMMSTMSSNMLREFFPNPMVVQSIDIADNDAADGSRTYTFTIYTDNQFSDGTFITAHHYAGAIALFNHPYWANIADVASSGTEIMGRSEWISGSSSAFSGVRLYNESTFSVTIPNRWLPYVWEMSSFMNWEPFPVDIMLPNVTITDNGDGVFLAGITEQMLIDAVMGSGGNDGWRFAYPVTAGPYVFSNFDPATSRITMIANPYFAGTFDGYLPRINEIAIESRQGNILVDSIFRGEIDMISGQGGVEIVDFAFTSLIDTQSHRAYDYPRNGHGHIRFHVDHGPTQFVAVRQAIESLIDRDTLVQQYLEGHGTAVYGAYSVNMWWYLDAVRAGLYDEVILRGLDVERAVELLEADGWVLNSHGAPFVAGQDSVRYKDVSGMELEWHSGGTDPSINEAGLMRLEIMWATTLADQNTDILNNILAPQMVEAGMLLIPTFVDNVTPLLTRSGGAAPQFHMFNLVMDFNASAYAPWNWLNPASGFLGGGFNTNFSRDSALFELANQLRFADISIDNEEGRADFVDAWIDLQVALNQATLDIPLYADTWYDFVPRRLQNWNNNAIWGFADAIVRAYVNE
ncbi:MAG: ABC transporter substrate-binding protein [Defluviitaleaceae bacterium]|nr:ABC transporter substrate-binding protein [Defluviitaleaceae bacterium]